MEPIRTPASAQAAFKVLADLSLHIRAPARVPRLLQRAAALEQAQNYFSELGSERFLGDFLSSKETNFCPEGGTGTAPSITICVAVTFLP